MELNKLYTIRYHFNINIILYNHLKFEWSSKFNHLIRNHFFYNQLRIDVQALISLKSSWLKGDCMIFDGNDLTGIAKCLSDDRDQTIRTKWSVPEMKQSQADIGFRSLSESSFRLIVALVNFWKIDEILPWNDFSLESQ